MEGCSFVTLPSTKVKELAKACLERIERRRKREWDEYIAQEQEKCRRSWFRRLFKIPVPSAEEIQAEARRDFWSVLIDRSGWGSEEAALRLLKAAEHGDVVNVSSRDLDMID